MHDAGDRVLGEGAVEPLRVEGGADHQRNALGDALGYAGGQVVVDHGPLARLRMARTTCAPMYPAPPVISQVMYGRPLSVDPCRLLARGRVTVKQGRPGPAGAVGSDRG